MPKWTNQPPTDLGRSGYRLIRTPAGRPLVAYVISEHLVGCPTHFYGGRTVPCDPPECDACMNGSPWRWHGYLAITIGQTSEDVLFEVTAAAAVPFKDYYTRYGTVRGCLFKAYRLGNKSNGRVLIETRPCDQQKVTLHKPPNVPKLLCHIWGVPESRVDPTAPADRPPAKAVTLNTKPEGRLTHVDPQTASGRVLRPATEHGGNGSQSPAD